MRGRRRKNKMTIKTQPETEYNLSTFRTNWKSRGFREAWRIDNAVTEARDASSPTVQDVHETGIQMAYDVNKLCNELIQGRDNVNTKGAVWYVSRSVSFPVGYLGGLVFGSLGFRPKTLEAEVSN